MVAVVLGMGPYLSRKEIRISEVAAWLERWWLGRKRFRLAFKGHGSELCVAATNHRDNHGFQ